MDVQKNVKVACEQMINGDNTFKYLYESVAGENSIE
jgi:hypothetical protein